MCASWETNPFKEAAAFGVSLEAVPVVVSLASIIASEVLGVDEFEADDRGASTD